MEWSSGGKGRRNKKLKLEEKEDRISSLPDPLLHHILSFLLSTVDAIQTDILSKRWQNQWTHVPVLIFDSGCGEHVAKVILKQLQNVKELSIGASFIKILSDGEMGGLYYPWSNNKILTLDRPNFEHLPGIMCALCSSPTLERLAIKLNVYKGGTTPYASEENYWNSNRSVINCLLPHLKTVEIIGLSKQDGKCKLVLKFIKFLLKKARLLEKLVLVISKDGGTDFAFKVSQKLSSFPRCSQHAIVELLYSH
ncbi:uncharacterized protein [Euphorbia lathyris]|uniref:uncharacterized protein isoform X2 n=1 Tax=Euphorbia lathyris TaxID=212925 RepID=UPI0033140144